MTPFRAAVILAAGGSRRMGSPKALLDWGGAPLVAAHVRALGPWAAEVVVVVGADAPRVAAAAGPVRLVSNAEWSTTHPIDSLRCALRTIAGEGRALVTPVDVPPADEAVLRALAAASGAAVPTFAGRDGHPVALDDLLRAGVLAGAGAVEGLRGLLVGAARVAVPVDVSPDYDTPADWAARTSR